MKIKLITNAGFSKNIEIKDKKLPLVINYPFGTKIQLNSPELYGIPVSISCVAKFRIEKKFKKYAVYKQIDAVVEIKD